MGLENDQIFFANRFKPIKLLSKDRLYKKIFSLSASRLASLDYLSL